MLLQKVLNYVHYTFFIIEKTLGFHKNIFIQIIFKG